MFRGTTPTYTFTAPQGLDMTQASNIYITFADQSEKEIFTKSGDEIEVTESELNVFLTQEETLKFPHGRVVIQINWTYNEGDKVKRACSDKMMIVSARNLIDEVI